MSAIDRETVARAMLRANSQCQIGGDGDWPRWETLTPPQQAKFLHIAEAAIAAMSNPATVAVPATMADGWRHDICTTLNRVMPSWIAAGKTPIEAACNAIEALATVACEADRAPLEAPIVWQYRFTTPDGLTWSDWQPIPSEEMARETVEIAVTRGLKAEWRSLAVVKEKKP